MFDGDQICFMSFYGRANLLADDLKQIRAEQNLSRQFRLRMGFHDDLDYRHCRVSV